MNEDLKVVVEWYSPYAMAQYRSKLSYRKSLEFKCVGPSTDRWSVQGTVPNLREELLALAKFGMVLNNPELYNSQNRGKTK